MAKVFGTEQSLRGTTTRAVNPDVPVRTNVRPVNVGSAVDNVIDSISDIAKQQADRALGSAIAKANSRIRGINNPIERQLAEDTARDELLSRFGASAVTKINAGLTARDLEQKTLPNGNVVNVDKTTQQIVSVASVNETPATIREKSQISDSVYAEQNMPNFTRAGNGVAQVIANSPGARVSTSAMADILDATTRSAASMEKRLILADNARTDPAISITATKTRHDMLIRDINNDVVTALQSFMHSGLAQEARRQGTLLTPQVVQDMASSYLTDIVNLMQEEGIASQLGIDLFEFRKNMQSIVKEVGEFYVNQRDTNLDRLSNNNKVSEVLVDSYKNNDLLELYRNRPDIAKTFSYKEVIDATLKAVQANDLTLARPYARGVTGQLTNNLMFMVSATEAAYGSNMARRATSQQINNVEDLKQFADTFVQVRESGSAPGLVEMVNYFQKNKGRIKALAASDPALAAKIEQMDKETQAAKKRIMDNLKRQGLSEEEVDNTFSIWNKVKDLFSGAGRMLGDTRTRERSDAR